MSFEVFSRIFVGAPLVPEAVPDLLSRFHASLGLPAGARYPEAQALLRERLPRHRRNEDGPMLYEQALQDFVDGLWEVDVAIGGVSEGGVDATRGYLFVGLRIEGFEDVMADAVPGHESRPRWLRKGDLTAGSSFAKEIPTSARKAFDHAVHVYQRATREVQGDARSRLKVLPVSKQHEPGWALVRWVVRRVG